MNPYTDAYLQSANMPDYSPPAELAKGVCLIRGQLPHNYVSTPMGQLTAWQAVIFEVALLEALRGMVANV